MENNFVKGKKTVITASKARKSHRFFLAIGGNKINNNFSHYTVMQGDTLYKIAKTFRVSLEEIANINPGINPIHLNIGGILAIPHTTRKRN